MPEKLHDLQINILMPSSYNQDRTLRQYRTTMMLPPALPTLHALAEKAGRDYGLNIAVTHFNERTERGDGYLGSIIKDGTARKSVTWIPTKSFEIPRAIDLARQLKRAGQQVVLGGPGITLADLKTYAFLMEEGIPFNVGEAENTAGQIIQDVMEDRLKPVYWQRGMVDMRKAPFPKILDLKEHSKTLTRLAALEISKGCPFNCSYCCVIKLEGQEVSAPRSRNVDEAVAWIEEAFARGYSDIFLTDNNFRKSFVYSAMKEPLKLLNADLRRKYGRDLSFFVQLDAKPDILNEVDDLADMGVKMVFQGYETNDRRVLKLARKNQNKPEMYQMIADRFRSRGIMVSSGVMIGFWPQTPDSIRKDVETSAKFLDLGYPFTVVPLPGSDDFMSAVEEGRIGNWDPNDYDGTECVFKGLQNMTPEQVKEAYHESFSVLYPQENSGNHVDQQKKPLLGYMEGRQLPAGRLAEMGLKYAGRPFHLMMDGIPYTHGSVVIRPEDSFRGIPLKSEDVQFIRKGNTDKERFLLQNAWYPDAVAA
ncbi:hypothetical protein HYS95_02365 [Candidatus Daviesbacteria bacterium]|nr:hypothetical protein [Candidatus Daviesbacteria bacterium]